MTNQTQVKHTPTPYYITETKEYIIIQSAKINEDNFVCSMQEPQEQDRVNAQFIVKACNAHDDLVLACKTLLKYMKNPDSSHVLAENGMALAEQALKKAGE